MEPIFEVIRGKATGEKESILPEGVAFTVVETREDVVEIDGQQRSIPVYVLEEVVP